MKKKTNKILLIAALVVVVLNLAIIGTGIALAARNSEQTDTDCTTVITLGDDEDTGITVITEDEDSDDPTVITINYDEDSYGVTVDSEDGTTVVSGETGE